MSRFHLAQEIDWLLEPRLASIENRANKFFGGNSWRCEEYGENLLNVRNVRIKKFVGESFLFDEKEKNACRKSVSVCTCRFVI